MKNNIVNDSNQDSCSTADSVTIMAVSARQEVMTGCAVEGRTHERVASDVADTVVSAGVDRGVSESIDSAVQDAYWRDTHQSRPYYDSAYDYDDYQPAYRFGWELRDEYSDNLFEELESALEDGWYKSKGQSALSWQKAKHATRDAWQRSQKRR